MKNLPKLINRETLIRGEGGIFVILDIKKQVIFINIWSIEVFNAIWYTNIDIFCAFYSKIHEKLKELDDLLKFGVPKNGMGGRQVKN